MTRLQEGHFVRVRRPKSEWRYIHPNFTEQMDRFVGQLLKVVSIVSTFGDNKIVCLEGAPGINTYQWRLEWLDTSLSNNIQNGDLL